MTALTIAPAQAADSHDATATGNIDRVIRISTALAVLAVAAVAANVSYWHAYAVVRAHGETGITARLEPATIDGLVYASSMVVLYAARHRLPAPALARWLLGLGIAATLTANMAQGWSHGPTGAAVAAWPAVGLVGSYELLVWLIRTAAPDQGPPAQQASGDTADTAPGRPVPAGTASGGQPGSGEGKAPDQARNREAARGAHGRAPRRAARRSGTARRRRERRSGGRVPAERASRNPLSERKLARMFGLGPPAAGRVPGSPRHGRHHRQEPPATQRSPPAPEPCKPAPRDQRIYNAPRPRPTSARRRKPGDYASME